MGAKLVCLILILKKNSHVANFPEEEERMVNSKQYSIICLPKEKKQTIRLFFVRTVLLAQISSVVQI